MPDLTLKQVGMMKDEFHISKLEYITQKGRRPGKPFKYKYEFNTNPNDDLMSSWVRKCTLNVK